MKRIIEIDIAKALGIICVLIGHRTNGVIASFIYLFHMPLFFILSGSMIKDEKMSFRDTISKESKLLSSYLVYSAIFMMLTVIRSRNIEIYIVNAKYALTFYGIHTLWFLSSLLGSKIIVRVLLYIPLVKIRHFFAIIIYIVCFWTSKGLLSINYDGCLPELFRETSWTIVRTGVVFIFVYLGFVFRNKGREMLEYLKQHLYINILVFIISGCILVPFALYEDVDYHLLKNGLFIFNIFYGFVGTVFIVSLAIAITKFKRLTKYLTQIGKSSIHYMASEYFAISEYSLAILKLVFRPSIYLQYINFGVYFYCLYLAIGHLSPFIDKLIMTIYRRINVKIYKEKNLNVPNRSY